MAERIRIRMRMRMRMMQRPTTVLRRRRKRKSTRKSRTSRTRKRDSPRLATAIQHTAAEDEVDATLQPASQESIVPLSLSRPNKVSSPISSNHDSASSVLSAAAQATLPVTHLRQTSTSAPPLVHPASPEARRRANKRKGKSQSKGLVKPKAKRQKLEVRNIGKVLAEGNVPAHWHKALIVLNDIIVISPTIPAAIADEALLLLRPLQAGSRDSSPDFASQFAPADQ
ncbi:hypothetical protein CF319_g8919 [Tilletia indica]|nr:hypothetical protein CF319_g8919 [Tilletia indica]